MAHLQHQLVQHGGVLEWRRGFRLPGSPLVLGELGQNDGGSSFVDSLMNWMDVRSQNYLAWTWDVWGQSLDLITSYDGTPTAYSQTFKTRFRQ